MTKKGRIREHKKIAKYHKPNSQFYPFLIQHPYTHQNLIFSYLKGGFSQLPTLEKKEAEI
jgi:hypothetical protein